MTLPFHLVLEGPGNLFEQLLEPAVEVVELVGHAVHSLGRIGETGTPLANPLREAVQLLPPAFQVRLKDSERFPIHRLPETSSPASVNDSAAG